MLFIGSAIAKASSATGYRRRHSSLNIKIMTGKRYWYPESGPG